MSEQRCTNKGLKAVRAVGPLARPFPTPYRTPNTYGNDRPHPPWAAVPHANVRAACYPILLTTSPATVQPTVPHPYPALTSDTGSAPGPAFIYGYTG